MITLFPSCRNMLISQKKKEVTEDDLSSNWFLDLSRICIKRKALCWADTNSERWESGEKEKRVQEIWSHGN